MIEKYKLFVLSMWFLLASCSSSKLNTYQIPIDSTAASIFKDRIHQRFTDYAEVSGYKHMKDSIDNIQRVLNTRGPDAYELILLRAKPTRYEFIIYTFDKKDSCVLFSDTLSDAYYELPYRSIPIPTGRYLLKDGNITRTMDRP